MKWAESTKKRSRSLRRAYQSMRMRWGGWGIILAYHRVAAPKIDPQLLCVSPDHFREHLEVLTSLYRPMPLQDMRVAVRSKDIPAWSVAITFDDGYADNLRTAVPLLDQFSMHGTVFVTGQVLDGQEFFYDVLEEILLGTSALPAELDFTEFHAAKKWSLGEWAIWPEEPEDDYWNWNIGLNTNPTPRHRAYREMFRWLRGSPPSVRAEVIQKLRLFAGAPLSVPRGMRPEDLVAAQKGGTLEIGAHTVTHPVLNELSFDDQEREIVNGKRVLEKIIGQPVVSFAYPFGSSWDVGQAGVQLAERAGFLLSCANMPGTVTPGSDVHWLPRFLVRDWTGDEFAQKLERFFNPQKIRPPLGK
jgi:peptidoglycan/xylan/chitin deacetylase (PgdA/CDA1 family)